MTSRWFYLVSALIALGGVGAAGAVGVSALIAEVEDMQRFAVPGEASLNLGGGEHVAYFEPGDVAIADLHCDVRVGDAHVALRPTIPQAQYSVGAYAGTSFFEFELERASEVSFACQATPVEGAGVLALGRIMGRGWMKLVIIGVASICAGAGLFFVTWFARRRTLLVSRASS
jgi:hypothetical protein